VSGAPRLVIVSGLSGAGRTTVMKALEDVGFYCVDNLPVVLLEPFVELFAERSDRLAAVIDVREGEFLDDFPAICDRLRSSGALAEVLFLDASDEELMKRFDETRRAHPGGKDRKLIEMIADERRILAPIAERADLVIDSTRLSVHDLKRRVTRHYTGASRGARMEIELVSFGFRHGQPEVADLMIDVRFLRNPHFEPGLREKTGLEPDVSTYVLENTQTRSFMRRLLEFLDFLVPLYETEGKAYLTIAIGCTGGQHRSVAVVAALERHMKERNIECRVTHRDVDALRRT
jgi:UPF0042 nucleotide-binding protein